MLSREQKRKAYNVAGTASGATLGYLFANTPGALILGTRAYRYTTQNNPYN
jgi:hypothetical protein